MKFSSYWILNNFEKCANPEEHVLVYLVYSAYSKFCNQVGEKPLSTFAFKHYVCHLMGCRCKFVIRNGKRRSVFMEISRRCHRDAPVMETTHQVAEFLQSSEEVKAILQVTDCSEKTVYCKLKEYSLNVTISTDEVELTLDGHKVDMNNLYFPHTFEWSAPNFITFTRLLTRLKFCEGWLLKRNSLSLKPGNIIFVPTLEGLRAYHMSCDKVVNFCRQKICCPCAAEHYRQNAKPRSAVKNGENPGTSQNQTPKKLDKKIRTTETPEMALCKAFPNLTSEVKSLMRETTINSQKTPKCRRWSKNAVMLARSLWLSSPQAYKDLMDRHVLVLPSVSLLRLHKNCTKQLTGESHQQIGQDSNHQT